MDIIELMKGMSLNNVEEETQFHLFAAKINGEHTDIVYNEFVNNCFIIASQYEKVGSLCKVQIDEPEYNLAITEPVYSVSTIFGAENQENEAACRYIAEKLNKKKPLLIFLTLKNYSPETIRALTEALINIPLKE